MTISILLKNIPPYVQRAISDVIEDSNQQQDVVLTLEGDNADFVIDGDKLKYPLSLSDIVSLTLSHASIVKIDKAGEFRLDKNQRILRNRESEELRLTEKECDLLIYLHSSVNGSLKDDILNSVWGYDSEKMDTATLETHVYRLRKKIEEFSNDAITIRVESGSYKLCFGE